jgi:hypothetical protein
MKIMYLCYLRKIVGDLRQIIPYVLLRSVGKIHCGALGLHG